MEWANTPNHRLWTFRMSDKFGDSGLTGIVSIELQGEVAHVADYLLSCRVMGRRVEETMVHHLVNDARQLGASRLVATYHPTEKNNPCLEFWRRSGFTEHHEHQFVWDLQQDYPKPDAVELIASEEPG